MEWYEYVEFIGVVFMLAGLVVLLVGTYSVKDSTKKDRMIKAGAALLAVGFIFCIRLLGSTAIQFIAAFI